ncbi:MAG: penicillin-binding transpeptidase domain-containing protein [bacterium]
MDGTLERGPVRYREALAGSYNLAAVHVLERVGVHRLIERLREAGLGPLKGTDKDYGLQLALGSAKVRLVNLAAAYGFLARNGRVTTPRNVVSVRRHDGTVWRPDPGPDRQLFEARTAWQVMDMLADPEARRPMFGQELPFDLPFRVAAKTGTSRGFADTVAVGVTRELTVAAWAGNFDGRPNHGLQAMSAAAPLVRDGLLIAGGGAPLTLPPAPQGIVKLPICPLSGMAVGPHCAHAKLEYFSERTLPRAPCTWHRNENGHTVAALPKEIRGWVAGRRPLTGGFGRPVGL